MPKIFVSVAAYNEKENIEKLIRTIFGLAINELNIVVTDDNSLDGTAAIVKSLKSKFNFLHLITRYHERGYGSAHLAGFDFALKQGADIIISLDADFSHDPADIPRLINEINKGADIAIASRKIKGGRIIGWNIWRQLASFAATSAARLIFGLMTKDVTTGFRAYRRELLEKINLKSIISRGYSLLEEILYYAERLNAVIVELPATFKDRELGVSKMGGRVIFDFAKSLLRLRYLIFKKQTSFGERLIFALLILSFFVGLWHAFPLLKVVSDEMYFVGGVLRAMENYSLLPAVGDVPYGTLTYFLNYILIGIFLIILLPFYSFSLAKLKLFLLVSPKIVYFIPRILSAFIALGLLLIFYKILKREFTDYRLRIFFILLLFTNMLTVLILHTGKVWVVSVFLVMLSFYYLYQSLIAVDKNKPIFLSMLLSFLAVANLPFFAFAFINIPLILFYFWRQKELRTKIVKYFLISLVVFAVILGLNFSSTKTLIINQLTNYNPILGAAATNNNLTVLASLWLNVKKIIAFFPLLLLTLIVVAKDKIFPPFLRELFKQKFSKQARPNLLSAPIIKNKPLFILGLSYFLVYYLSLSILGTWATGLYKYIRYCFPFGFFLILIMASFNFKFKKIFYFIGAVSLLYFIPTLYFLSAPTTLNQARAFIINNLNQPNAIIINNINYLDLPKNPASYELETDYYCASKCKNIIDHNLNSNYYYLVYDKYTIASPVLSADQAVYYIDYTFKKESDRELIASFTNSASSGFSLDGRMANYFDLDFFRLKNFGPDIYIYKKIDARLVGIKHYSI